MIILGRSPCCLICYRRHPANPVYVLGEVSHHSSSVRAVSAADRASHVSRADMNTMLITGIIVKHQAAIELQLPNMRRPELARMLAACGDEGNGEAADKDEEGDIDDDADASVADACAAVTCSTCRAGSRLRPSAGVLSAVVYPVSVWAVTVQDKLHTSLLCVNRLQSLHRRRSLRCCFVAPCCPKTPDGVQLHRSAAEDGAPPGGSRVTASGSAATGRTTAPRGAAAGGSSVDPALQPSRSRGNAALKRRDAPDPVSEEASSVARSSGSSRGAGL